MVRMHVTDHDSFFFTRMSGQFGQTIGKGRLYINPIRIKVFGFFKSILFQESPVIVRIIGH